MRVSSVKAGDIVRVDDGLKPFFAMALEPPERMRLNVRTIGWRTEQRRTVKTTDVTGIWHQSKHTNPRAHLT